MLAKETIIPHKNCHFAQLSYYPLKSTAFVLPVYVKDGTSDDEFQSAYVDVLAWTFRNRQDVLEALSR